MFNCFFFPRINIYFSRLRVNDKSKQYIQRYMTARRNNDVARERDNRGIHSENLRDLYSNLLQFSSCPLGEKAVIACLLSVTPTIYLGAEFVALVYRQGTHSRHSSLTAAIKGFNPPPPTPFKCLLFFMREVYVNIL